MLSPIAEEPLSYFDVTQTAFTTQAAADGAI